MHLSPCPPRSVRSLSVFLIVLPALIISFFPMVARAEIILSEIMYHPLPATENDDSESLEFIELYNPGPDEVELSDYAFDRGITFTFPTGTILAANQFLVVAREPRAVETAYGIDQVSGPFEGTLSNSGETLQLKTDLNQTVFSVRYGTTGHWPAAADGTGHSLVFSDALANPHSGRNWEPSQTRAGSPGQPDFRDNDNADLSLPLIQKGTVGRYFKGIMEPSGGSTDWTLPDFEADNRWLTGESGFGYSSEAAELVPVSTRLPDMRGNYLSLYVRLPFELSPSQIDRLASLSLVMNYDDSYVIYLNGTRVAASGVNGTPPSFDQTSIEGADYPPHNLDLSQHQSELRAGQNILAIQGHNIGLNSSSDFVLGPELTLTLNPDPSPEEGLGSVQINELQTNHLSLPDFVEFYNPTDTPIDLGGAWLSDKADQLALYQFPEPSIIGARDFLILPISIELTGFALSSLGEQVFLTSADQSTVITALGFGPQEPNTSIVRFPDGGRDWFTSGAPTPDAPNSRPSEPAVAITEVMYHDVLTQRNEFIEIRNLGTEPVAVGGWELEGVRFRFDNETLLEPGTSYIIADNATEAATHYGIPQELLLGSYGGSLNNGGERLSVLTADGLTIDTVSYQDTFPWPVTPDGLGASLERRCFTLEFNDPNAWSASPLNRPSPGRLNNVEDCRPTSDSSIRISEVLYHPSTSEIDDRAGEFIELVNTGPEPVSLAGWVMAGDVFYVFPDNAALPPNEARILAWSPGALAALNSLDRDLILGPYLQELPNGNGELLLVRPDGRLADRVRYHDDFPWPSIADGGTNTNDEISLQRVCLQAPGDDPANWQPESQPSPGIITLNSPECHPTAAITNTGTLPARVTRLTEPVVYVDFAGPPPSSATVTYWIDDPEIEGEPTIDLALDEDPGAVEGTSNVTRWSATLPAQADNTIVRYQLAATYADGLGLISPSPDRDAFATHAYFVDPQIQTQLPNSYHLFISSSNWSRLHSATAPGRVSGGRANPRWNEEVPATFVANGVVHDVEVRHQGSRWNRTNGSTIGFNCESHRSGQAQVRSWRIDFPAYRNHNGMDVIILQKQSGWPQNISFKMFELAGVPAPRTSWANLRINGCDYNNDAFQIERPGRDLVARWFDEVGDLFKSQGFTGHEGPWSWGDERLIVGARNGSSEQERYEHTYNRKTLSWKNDPFDGKEDFPEAMIEGLHRARSQGTEALRQWLLDHFDVDRTLRYIATINYVGTFDDMFQNHYIYREAETGRWSMFPWDMDNTLGGAYGETNANPFRGVDERRHGNVNNRAGWWNRLKDSFFIAFEAEFIETFHRLNTTVHHPDALMPYVQEAAAIRGLGRGSVDSLMRHLNARHEFLNQFLSNQLPPPRLVLSRERNEISLEWASHRDDVLLEHASSPLGPWRAVSDTIDSPLVISDDEPARFFRLIQR